MQNDIGFEKKLIETSIPHIFEQRVKQYPENIAVKSQISQLNYTELNQAANRLASAILNLNPSAEEPIGLLFDHDVSAVTAILGVLKTGRMYIPFSPGFPVERLHYMSDDASIGLVVTDQKNYPLAQTLASTHTCEVLNIDQITEAHPDTNPGVSISPDTPCVLLYTSGSTAKPKGVIHSHRSVLHDTWLTSSANQVTPNGRVAFIVSYCFAGSMSETFSGLLSGAMLCMLNPKEVSAARMAEWLRSERINILKTPGGLLKELSESATSECHFPDLSAISTGMLDGLDYKRFRRHITPQCVMFNRLASTETTMMALFPITVQTELDDGAVPVGFPVEDKEVLILDDNGEELAAGEIGEIVVRSRYLAIGYWGQPELTRQKFRPDPKGGVERLYFTGDLGRVREDGCYEHLGRKDFRVKIRGYSVQISEVETALNSLSQVKEAVVAALSHESGDQYLAAYMVGEHGDKPSIPQLRRALAEKIPDFMIPAFFTWIGTIPLTPNGKVDRQALPAPDRARPDLEKVYCPPGTPTEEQLVKIWENLLDISPIGVKDNFFDLGGDSLAVLRLYGEIEKAFDQVPPYTTILQAPTIEDMAQRLDQKQWDTVTSSLIPIQSGSTSRPPLFMFPGLRGGVINFVQIARHLGVDQPVYGLRPRGFEEDEEPDTNIEEMATRYISEIQMVQPEGPYYLAGYSFGGVVAFETAQQLQARGHTVAFLGLIDCTPPDYQPLKYAWKPASIINFIDNLPYWLATFRELNYSKIGVRIQKKIVGVINRLLRSRSQSAESSSKILTDRGISVSTLPEDRLDYMKVEVQAKDQYTPSPYPGSAFLFRARRQSLAHAFDAEKGWKDLITGGLDICSVDGNHQTMIFEPEVVSLCFHMRRCIDETIGAFSSEAILSPKAVTTDQRNARSTLVR